MIIAEYTLDHPILRETLRRVPEAKVTWEDSFTDPGGRMRMLAWVDCDDFDAVDRAMAEDSTVADPTVLAEAGGRRLYRFDVVNEGAESSVMPVIVDVGGVHQELTADRDGWWNRTQFPDRDAFETVYHFCRDRDIDFTFDRIYERSEWFGSPTPGLTEAQHETLVEAVESGYLDVPRRSSLAELGERMGVSESAASERFRRGAKRLVRETLVE